MGRPREINSEITALFDGVGREKLCRRLNTSSSNLRNCESAGSIPSSWYGVITLLMGKPAPIELFSFKAIEKSEASSVMEILQLSGVPCE